MLGVGDEGRVVAFGFQGFGKRDLVFGNALPAGGEKSFAFLGDPVPEGPGPQARVDRPPGGDRRDGLGVSPGKPQAFFRQRVEVRGLYPVVPVGPT